MQKIKNNLILILSIFFLLATVSAKYTYVIETMFTSLFKYGVAILIILFTFGTAYKAEMERRRLGKYIQLEWIFLFFYGMLFFMQHQFFTPGYRLAFGIPMGIANGIQKLGALFIGCYILKSGDKKFCRAIIITFLIIIIIDSITTLQAVQINDQALRLATMEDAQGKLDDVEELGVGNVLNIFSYITCIPIMFFLFVNEKNKLLKIGVALIILLVAVSVVNAGFTMAMIIMAVALFALLANSISKKTAVKIMFVIIVLFLVFCIDWKEIILFVGTKISNVSVKERLSDVYNFLEYGSQGDALSSRTDNYIRGLEGFLQSPIIGNVILDTRKISDHSTIIDIMSNWGIIGIFLYGSYLFNMFRASVFFVDRKDVFYIVVASILFVVSFAINPIGGYVHSIATIAVFFAAASKYVYLKKEESTEHIVEHEDHIITDIEKRSCIKKGW